MGTAEAGSCDAAIPLSRQYLSDSYICPPFTTYFSLQQPRYNLLHWEVSFRLPYNWALVGHAPGELFDVLPGFISSNTMINMARDPGSGGAKVDIRPL